MTVKLTYIEVLSVDSNLIKQTRVQKVIGHHKFQRNYFFPVIQINIIVCVKESKNRCN